jgi:hypothetical protein
LRYDTIAFTAKKKGGSGNAMQPSLELRIVHPRLPGQQSQSLTCAEHGGDFPVCHFCYVAFHAAWIVVKKLLYALFRHGEDVGNIELVGWADLYADRAYQHQATNALRRFGGYFRRDPAADRATDDVEVAQIHAVHQLEIEVGDVVHAIEPIRQTGLTKARMRGSDQSAPRRQRRDKWLSSVESVTTVQEKKRTALPIFEQLKVDVRNFHLGRLHQIPPAALLERPDCTVTRRPGERNAMARIAELRGNLTR